MYKNVLKLSFALILLITGFSIPKSSLAQSEPVTLTDSDSLINIEENTFGINAGGGYIGNSFVGEIGYGAVSLRPLKFLTGNDKKSIFEKYMAGQAAASAEFFQKGDNWIVAPKVGVVMGFSFVNLTYANFLYYTDFTSGAFSYRPELGVSYRRGRLFYGYNIPLSNKEFLSDMRHYIGLTYQLGVVKSWTRKTYQNTGTGEYKSVIEDRK